jgi:hypothetical protein
VSDYDVIVMGGGAAGARCAPPSLSESWWAASAPTGLVFRRSRCFAPGEAVAGAREVGASAQVDVQAALAWRDFMVSNYSDAGNVSESPRIRASSQLNRA